MADIKFRHKMTIFQFGEVLSDFAAVVDDYYEKLSYQTWRTLNRLRGDLQIEWHYSSVLRAPEIKISETEGVSPQMVYLLANDNSFGEFFYENILTFIEGYSKYDSLETSLATSASNEIGFLSTSTDSTVTISDPIDTWSSIEDTWKDELSQKTDIADFRMVSDTVSKLCESATLAAPMNNNHIKKENNVMNFNFDFGPVNPSLVRMSMYGLAVKNKAGTWVSFNAEAGEIVDVDVLNFDGAKFLYRMPVAIKDIAVGDVVIHNSAPMFVVATPNGGKVLTVIDTINGERKDIMLPRSPFGFNFATKVVNFLGNMMTGATADNPFGNMWMLMAMSGDNKDMGDILPLMMLSGANGGNVDPNMMMFLALSGDKSNKDMLPWLLMSQSMNAAPAHTCKCGGNCGENHAQN